MRFLRQLKSLLRMFQRLTRLLVRRSMVLLAMMRRRGLMGMGRLIVEFYRALSSYVHRFTSSA